LKKKKEKVFDVFYINEEAYLIIPVQGGTLYADIFIEEDKPRILKQGYSSRHPFMR
jgi:hypothetical protein